MSKPKNKSKSQNKRRSPVLIVAAWVASLLSLLLLYVAGSSVIADLGSFRSCSSNSSGLSVTSCGKASINPGDLLLLVLFILVAAVTLSLFNAAWQLSWRTKG